MPPITMNEKIIFFIEFILYSFQLSVLFVLLAKIRKELNSAFYHVLLIIFISDFVYYVFVTVIILRLPKYGIWRDFYENNGWFGSMGYTFSGFLAFIQFFGQVVISFNRFSLFWFPTKHQRIWASKWYLIAVLLVPFLLVCYRIPAEGYYKYHESGEVSVGYVSLALEQTSASITSTFMTIFSISSLIISILTIIKYAHLRKSSSLVAPDKQLNLLVFSILLLIVQSLRTAYRVLLAAFISYPAITSFLHDILPLLSDAHAWFAAIGILILSPTTKKIYCKFYGFNKATTFVSVTVNSRFHGVSAVVETSNLHNRR